MTAIFLQKVIDKLNRRLDINQNFSYYMQRDAHWPVYYILLKFISICHLAELQIPFGNLIFGNQSIFNGPTDKIIREYPQN